ncbi:hypothetical protein AB0P17_06435 [Streptomyces sp. NPDC088124]|uniref:hypothetical protein n=1 Tax=Streptomyces sp. NPDC088124 TaxID=3154654 RepID=UPI00341E9F9C
MRLATSLRSGCVRWASPFALALTLFYYNVGETQPLTEFHGYAPALVASPLMMLYAFSYAISASLAAWESGRLSAAGIWQLAPARSRFRIAANIVLPVVLLSWTMLLLPPAVSLIRTTTLPTVDSLRLPAMALCLCVAHATIGFAIGLRVPRVFAVPIVAVVDFIMVAFTRAVHPYWLRHVSGQYKNLNFGEVPALSSIAAPLLFGGGLAVGIAIMWLPLRSRLIRGLSACLVAALGIFSAYHITSGWGHDPSLISGRAPVTCRGQAPKICMPTATAAALANVRKESLAALTTLRSRGVPASPEIITDRLAEGRSYRPSTNSVWRLSLTSADRTGGVRYQVAMTAVRFPCDRADAVPARAALLWAASVVGEQERYTRSMKAEARSPQQARDSEQIHSIVKDVLVQPVEKQSAWFQSTLTAACGGSGR